MAAAFCLSAHAPAGAPAAQATAHHAVVPNAANHAGSSPAQLVSANRPAKKQKPASAGPTWYTVRSGDSLTAIAGRVYHNAAAWPVLYWTNHGQVRWADDIATGQVLRIPAEPAQIPGAPAQLGPPAPPAPAPAAAAAATAPSAPTNAPAQAAPQQAAPEQAPAPQQAGPMQSASVGAASTYSDGTPGGSFGQCVVSRESGGQSQVMNSSGHYGLYQFSASTWAEYGGSPADFGNASVAEQNQVFSNALASGGESNWSAYDGC
jgi:LysM repeat protein